MLKEKGGVSDAERDLLRRSVRDFLATAWPVDKAVEDAGNAEAVAKLWAAMARQGLTSLGSDATEAGVREILLVFEELGRASCPAPLLGAVAANLALAAQPSDNARALLEEIHEGKAIVALALGAFDGDGAAGRVAMRGNALTGKASFVEGAEAATHFIVLTENPSGAAAVVRSAPGLKVRATPGLAVPPLCELTFENAPAMFLGVPSEALADIAVVAKLVCAARALGAAERAFELAVDHAKVRKQFGQLIGQFQAVQHKLANCLISLDGARLALESAAEARDGDNPDWRFFVSSAIAFAGPALRAVSFETHRALGAIGYAEEHEAPRHFRRVHADVARFGGVTRARADVAGSLLGSSGTNSTSCLPAHDMGSAATAFRNDVRAWLAKNWTEEKREAHRRKPFKERGWDVEFSKLMGRDGWIGVGWPKQFGGQGRSASEQIAFVTEMANAGAPCQAHGTGESIVAQALFLHGTKEQQEEWLPAIRRGERSFALGYSEPEAGSDLAALRTRAVLDGDMWIVNGQKLWSTGADKAQFIWLAVRTDADAKKHAGISVLMVDLSSPGVTLRPSLALYGKTFSAQFYDNVRVPAKNLVGGVNNGWKVITDALAAERVMIGAGRMATIERAFEHLVQHLRTAVVGDKLLRDDPVIRDRIGALAADIEVARQFQIRNSRLVEDGRVPIHEAAMGKVFSAELQERLGEAALDILGAGGLLSEDSDSAPVGEMEQVLRHAIMGMIGGGTNEIQRNVIAQRGLGLPR